MRVLNYFLIAILALNVLVLAGCKEKVECETALDCNTGNECFTPRCTMGKCNNIAKNDCCGNRQCESSVAENSCTCPFDCGKCAGKATYNVTSTRGIKTVNATYSIRMCVDKECITAVDPSKVNTLSLINTLDRSGVFRAEILTTINNPFDTDKDNATIRITLKDLNSAVIGGITFRSIQVLDGANLMGEAIINQKLSDVGDVFSQQLKLKSSQSMVEEEKAVTISFDYEYATPDSKGNPVTKRSNYKTSLADKIFFVVQ
jgi:hypothetical protein